VDAEVWILHSRREVVVTDLPGPLVGNGVLGDVVYVGRWPLPEYGWGEAETVAQDRAKALGYRVRHSGGG
jgi:hypothetical protein